MKILEFLRQFKIIEYAIFDIVVSVLGMYLLSSHLSKFFKRYNIDIPKVNWMYFALPIGIIAHLLVGNITPMTRDFIDIYGHYPIKIIIVLLIILGFKGIKKIK